MSLWHCTECTTAYAVGLPSCPHCRSTSKEEDAMPKITAHGGPSYGGHVDVSGPRTVTPEWTPAPEVVEPQTAPEPVKHEDDKPADDKSRKVRRRR